MDLTLARFRLLKEQRKEDSLHCEQDMHLKERGVVFAIASDLPSLHLETREPRPLRHIHTTWRPQPSPLGLQGTHAALPR